MDANVLFNKSIKAKVLMAFFSFTLVFGQENSVVNPNSQEQTRELHEQITSVSQSIAGSEDTFSAGKGYLIQLPKEHPITPTTYSGTFYGVPNNGTINIELKAGFNLAGNPYPSCINVAAFIDANTATTGTLYLLKKMDPGSSVTSYATLTKAAYVSNGSKSDDAVLGYFEAGDESNWFLNSAQGFLVYAPNDSKLIFTNSMRRIGRSEPDEKHPENSSPKKGWYWLNLNAEDGIYSQMAVGYSAEGSLSVDYGMDGRNVNQDFHLSSLIDNNDYAIQGRPEFDAIDVVPLSYKVGKEGKYSVSIDHVVGLFEGNAQAIYLRDKAKKKVHNLTVGAYSFFSEAGTFADRFEIVYEAH